jgi:hypothetical protein
MQYFAISPADSKELGDADAPKSFEWKILDLSYLFSGF